MSKSNSNGMVFVEMSPELAEFVIENCDSNIQTGLKMIDPMGEFSKTQTRGGIERVVSLNEKFKMLKNATERALR